MSQETIRTLETLRQRLNTLATSLGKLRLDLETHDPLPSWPSIQNSSQLLTHNLITLHNTLTAAQPHLAAAHVYPLPLFPGRTQEDLLAQLLRKKLQPGVEDWIDQGLKLSHDIPGLETGANGSVNGNGAAAGVAIEKQAAEVKGLHSHQLENVWEWAGPEANRIIREDIGTDAFGDVFTLYESNEVGIENVATGLQRKLVESEDEDSDNEDGDDMAARKKKEEQEKQDKMDVDQVDEHDYLKQWRRPGMDESRSPLPLELVLKAQLTGQLPPALVSAEQSKT